MKKTLFFLVAALTMTATVFAQSNVKFGLPKAKNVTLNEEFNSNYKKVQGPINMASTKDNATVDYVYALSLDDYYGMFGYTVSGFYQLEFVNGEDDVLFATIMSQDMNHIAGTYAIDSASWVAGVGDTAYVNGTLTLTYYSEGTDDPVYTVTFSGSEVGGQRTLSFTNNVPVWAINYLQYMLGGSYGITLLDAPIPEPTDTISLNILTHQMIEGDAAFAFFGYTADSSYAAEVAVASATIPGTYTDADMILDYCQVINMTTRENSTVREAHATVTATTDGYSVDAYMLCQNAHCYHVQMTYTTPVAQDTINMVINNAEFEDYSDMDGSYLFAGYDANNNEAVVTYYANAVAPATFTYEDCDPDYTYITYLGSEVDIYSLQGSSVATADGYQVEAFVLGTDCHCYHVTFNYTTPVAEDTIAMVFDEVTFYDYSTSDGSYLFTASDQAAGIGAQVNYYADAVAPATFTYSDCDPQYTKVMFNGELVRIYSLEGATVATATGYQVEMYVLATDNHCYHVTFNYSTPVAQDTINMVFDDVTFYDYSTTDGSYMFVASDQAAGIGAQVNYYADAVAPATFTYNDCDPQYTKIAYNNALVNIYSLEGSAVATATGYQVQMYALASDNHCYHVTFNYTQTGINTVENVKVALYPNPATEVLNVEADGVKEVSIMDLNGRVVMSQANAGSINISTLSNGVYVVRTITNEGTNVQKIVKK